MAKPNAESSEQPDKSRFPTIERAELAGSYFTKHVTFIIRTPTNKKISRRYSDFEWLRSWLKQTFPGAFIPPIPPKLPVAAWPSGYLLMRKRELQQFLHRCEIIPYLQNDKTVKYFLQYHKNSDDFEKARKEWDKLHKRPSFRATYDKLKSTFPEIDELKTPDDMDQRIIESRVLMESTINQLDAMIHASNDFVKHCGELQSSFEEMEQALTELCEVEYEGMKSLRQNVKQQEANNEKNKNNNKNKYNYNYGIDIIKSSEYMELKRIDVTSSVKQYEMFNKGQSTMIDGFIDPILRRSIFDAKVIRDILNTRDRLIHEHSQAKAVAQRWKTNYSQENLRASQIAAKHRDIQREEDLSLLTNMINKLSLSQLNLVFSANVRRWHKAQNNVIEHHNLALEKVLGSWRTLINKCIVEDLESNTSTGHVYKALIVEDLEEKDPSQQIESNNNNNNNSNTNEIVTETISNPVDVNGNNIVDEKNNVDDDNSNEKGMFDDDINEIAAAARKAAEEQAAAEEAARLEKERIEAENEAKRLEEERLKEERREKTMKEVNDIFGNDDDSDDNNGVNNNKETEKVVEKGLFGDNDNDDDNDNGGLFGNEEEDVPKKDVKSAQEIEDDLFDTVETQGTVDNDVDEEDTEVNVVENNNVTKDNDVAKLFEPDKEDGQNIQDTEVIEEVKDEVNGGDNDTTVEKEVENVDNVDDVDNVDTAKEIINGGNENVDNVNENNDNTNNNNNNNNEDEDEDEDEDMVDETNEENDIDNDNDDDNDDNNTNVKDDAAEVSNDKEDENNENENNDNNVNADNSGNDDNENENGDDNQDSGSGNDKNDNENENGNEIRKVEEVNVQKIELDDEFD